MKISGIYLLNMILLGLFGWAMVAYYHASEDIKVSITNSSDGLLFTLNISPLVLGIIVAGTAGVMITRKQRKKGKGWLEVLFLPSELKEDDEREKILTAKACRNAYISMMFTFPVLAICMLAEPFISDYFSAYPIVILTLYPAVQMTVFYVSLKKRLG